MKFRNPFQKKNEVWKYRYESHEIMITLKKPVLFNKASRIALYLDGEKVNESLLRMQAVLEGTLSNGETVFVRLKSGIDNVDCFVIVGTKPNLEKHGKNISDDEVATFATMGMLSAGFPQITQKNHPITSRKEHDYDTL